MGTSDEPTEIALDIRHVTGTERELLTDVVALADTHRRTLGLLPRAAFADAADRGTLLVALVDGTLAGYAFYSLPRQVVRLTHLCVAQRFQGRGIARALVDNISDKHRDRFGIVARCRNDYAENAMWPHLGFEARNEVAGRSAQRLPLTVWWRDHGHPDLFSSSDSSTVLKVAIDLNVFLDLEIRDSEGGTATSQALTQDWLAEQIGLVITSELTHEIERLPDGKDKERQRRLANRYLRPQFKTATADKISLRLIDHIKSVCGMDLSLNDGDKSDVRHIAETPQPESRSSRRVTSDCWRGALKRSTSAQSTSCIRRMLCCAWMNSPEPRLIDQQNYKVPNTRSYLPGQTQKRS